MNWYRILFFIVIINTTFCILSCYPQELEIGKREVDLSKKVVRTVLNQNEPAEVRVGLQGITTLQFPAKIEAIDGYGFAQQPNPKTDEFQLSYSKGTNFFSLKALRPGVKANLTVVINEKVYSLYCEEDSDPSFVVIFGAPGENSRFIASGVTQPADPGKKVVSPAALLGFLDKVKGYPTLLTAAPDSVASLSVAEPNRTAAVNEIETVIKRVIRDDALDSLGFEVQLNNRSQKDYYFDPEGFAVRVGEEKYEQSISDAGGIVPAGTSVPAFFAVTGTATGGRNDLAVTQNFDLEIRTLDADKNPTGTTNFTEPPANYLPTAANGRRNAKSAKGTDSKAAQKKTGKGVASNG
jgi:hypothetical protein